MDLLIAWLLPAVLILALLLGELCRRNWRR